MNTATTTTTTFEASGRNVSVDSPPESFVLNGTHVLDSAHRSLQAEPLRPTARLEPREGPRPSDDRRFSAEINWANAFWLLFLHVGAVAAFWTYSWQGLAVMFLLHWVTGGIGVCMGYHRLLTHGSFQTYRPVRWLLALCGSLAGEGPPIDWVANHRKHHALSDQFGDPHSPRDGGWWSHVLWIVRDVKRHEHQAHVKRWTPDLVKEPMMRALGYLFLPLHFLMGGLLFGAGFALEGLSMGLSLLVWGLFVRLVWVMHCTWFVNSACHMWGYRNYATRDDSRNSWWVALLAYGEGWHNNHHAYPRMANHGHRWWEFDLTFRTIRLLERLGIVWNVIDYKHRQERPAA
ncbi:MAG: acyl-CoA desaturase [Pirellulaceae bacterium]